jgi:hypothetical protein
MADGDITITGETAEDYLRGKAKEGSRLAEQLEEGVVTPIELAKAIDVFPQMIYNYIRNGRLAAHTTTDTQKIVIQLGDAKEFVRARLEKDARKAAQVQAELEGVAKAG